MTTVRSVYLGNRRLDNEDEDRLQWAVKIGHSWTECDVLPDGSNTTINGGRAGGWWGWGARPDGPMVTSVGARSGVTLSPGHASLGHTSRSDEDIEVFNKEFVKHNKVYR